MHLVVSLSLLILSTAGLASMSVPASAQGRYCLQDRGWGYPGNCAFATYAQCQQRPPAQTQAAASIRATRMRVSAVIRAAASALLRSSQVEC